MRYICGTVYHIMYRFRCKALLQSPTHANPTYSSSCLEDEYSWHIYIHLIRRILLFILSKY